MALLGLGAGTCFPALVGLAMSGVKMEQAGLASGLVNTTAQVGGALGLAVLATLSTTRSAAPRRPSGHSVADSLVGGYHLAFWIATGLLLAALAIGAVLLNSVAAAPTSTDIEHPAETEAGVDEPRSLLTV